MTIVPVSCPKCGALGFDLNNPVCPECVESVRPQAPSPKPQAAESDAEQQQQQQQQAPSHEATEASSGEQGTGDQASGTSDRTSAPSDDYRIRLPQAWPLRCYGKVLDQTNRLREIFHLAQNYYHDDRRVYDGKAISPERAGELFTLAHALLVNVAQGAAGVYAAAGLEVPPEIDWAARGAIPPSALPSPSLKPQASPLSSLQSATPTDAGLSPSSDDAAVGRSLPGEAA